MSSRFGLLCLIVLSFLQACKNPDEAVPQAMPVTLQMPYYLGKDINTPADNPLTEQGIVLGRMLFYEKMLSVDNSISCASCHKQKFAFSDNNIISKGVGGKLGARNSMSLTNLLWRKSFFWDGRAATLEQQALMPIQDPVEMHQTLAQAVGKLQNSATYPSMFKAAFGTKTITPELIGKALAQFERTLVSGNSKYDQFIRGEYVFSPAEERGFQLFFTHPTIGEGGRTRGGNCGDCHLPFTLAGDNFETKGFKNNGLTADFANVADRGLENFTHDPKDRGKFKVPTLRNIGYTAPYMHDGRFQTLEEVLDHYNDVHLFKRPFVDTLIKAATNQRFATSLMLTAQEKQDIIAFLKTLDDEAFIRNPAFADPFKK